MEINIKRATLNDLKTIQTLNDKLFKFEMENRLDSYVETWPFSNNAEDYFNNLIENQFVAIAECDNNVAGYLAGSIYQDETYSCYEGITAELENMFVEENYRKYGVGSRLIEHFNDYCKMNDVKRIIVTASFGNNDAINFYKKNGFNDYNIQLRKEL